MTFGKKEDETPNASELAEAFEEPTGVPAAVAALFQSGGSKSLSILLEAAEEAIMKAETPGEMQRIRRMVKSKIRELANVQWLKENRT